MPEPDPAPAYPDPLEGERAPLMLDYLPSYEEANEHIRAILQAEGYRFDEIVAWVRDDFPLVFAPLDCPAWALPFWEHTMGLPDRSGWTDADRRLAIQAFFNDTVTPAQLIDFAAKQAVVDDAQLALRWAANAVTAYYGTLTAPQAAEVAVWLTKAMPAHLTLTMTAGSPP